MNCVVSVIVPNYCHSQYLDERILSILNQTYQDFELIILDDCSPDNGASKEVIERYRNNPHVSHIVYNKVNSGSPFKQWHKGFELAEGKYIWIAESDDKCDNRLLEILVDACQKDDAVLAFCKSQAFYDNDEQFIYESQHPLGTTYICIKTGVSSRETFTILNYLSTNGYIKGLVKKLQFRLKSINLSKKINEEDKKKIIGLWIKYYFYRFVLFVYMTISR